MDYKLFIYIFTLFVSCIPKFLFKEGFMLQELLHAAIFCLIFYLTYDIIKINYEGLDGYKINVEGANYLNNFIKRFSGEDDPIKISINNKIESPIKETIRRDLSSTDKQILVETPDVDPILIETPEMEPNLVETPREEQIQLDTLELPSLSVTDPSIEFDPIPVDTPPHATTPPDPSIEFDPSPMDTPTPAAAPNTADLFTVKENTAIGKNDMSNGWKSNATIEQCENECKEAPGCKAFSYVKSTGVGCSLKNGTTNMGDSDGWDTYILNTPASTTPPDPTVSPFKDVVINDTVTCTTNDPMAIKTKNMAFENSGAYRYGGNNMLQYYPTNEIAITWNPDWGTEITKIPDCSKAILGSPNVLSKKAPDVL